MSFQNIGLFEEIVHGVQRLGYLDPTPIQQRAIPLILSGKDLIGSAQTGTGKTGGFALPILALLKTHHLLRCLVLEPTRELAVQVEEAFQDYAFFTNLKISAIYGGVGYGNQKKALSEGLDVLVATPGRLLDHLKQGSLQLNDIQFLVLDEVDRMLDMGFLPDVKRIISYCPTQRQTLLFSATIPSEIERLASWVLKNPEVIEIGERRSPAETVSHAFYPVATTQKFELLLALLENTHYESVIVFCRTKAGADRIAEWLKTHEHSVVALHSDRSQSERMEALSGFKSGKYEVLVATDIAARGLDIAGVSHVINYDIPENPEDYVHRIGRTGRAETTGDAFTIITGEDLQTAEAIEHYMNRKVPRKKLDEFNYLYTALFNESPTSSNARKRFGGRFRRR